MHHLFLVSLPVIFHVQSPYGLESMQESPFHRSIFIQTLFKLLVRTLKRGRKHSGKGLKMMVGFLGASLQLSWGLTKTIGKISQAVTEVAWSFLSL